MFRLIYTPGMRCNQQLRRVVQNPMNNIIKVMCDLRGGGLALCCPTLRVSFSKKCIITVSSEENLRFSVY